MSWEIRSTATVEPDLARLTLDEQIAISSDLLGWVEPGPPRRRGVMIGGAQAYEDELACGFRVTYFTSDTVPYVAIIRIRKR